MMADGSRTEVLYGTREEPSQAEMFSLGELSFCVDAGSLRWVTYGAIEILRGASFLARDPNWAVCPHSLSDFRVTKGDGGLSIRFSIQIESGHQSIDLEAEIEAPSSQSLVYRVEGRTETGFDTNRSGFTFLLPSEELQGVSLTITHTDGSREETSFPDCIMPSQPAMDIAALSYRPLTDIEVTCTLDDDAYELEDQRNWSDASFKGYYRPLAKPRPYHLQAGSEIRQSLTVDIVPRASLSSFGYKASTAPAGEVRSHVPAMALWADPNDLPDLDLLVTRIARSGLSRLICGFDPRRNDHDRLAESYRALAERTDLRLTLEATLPLRDRSGDFTDATDVLDADVAAIGEFAAIVGAFDQIMAVPECYRHSYQPSETWPKCPELDDIHRKLRFVFPTSAIGGGMHSYFTELNRKPPSRLADFVFHSFCPIVHAADDATVMENLRSLYAIGTSARAMLPEKPYWVGPSGLSMRLNPYGAAPVANPENIRLAMSAADPRMRGLFGAAWALGVTAEFAKAGCAGLCLASVSGGNACFRSDGGGVHPIYLVLSGLGALSGAHLTFPKLDASGPIAALCIEEAGRNVFWIAGLSDKNVVVQLPELGDAKVARLNAGTAPRLCAAPEDFESSAHREDVRNLELDAYEVVRIVPAT